MLKELREIQSILCEVDIEKKLTRYRHKQLGQALEQLGRLKETLEE